MRRYLSFAAVAAASLCPTLAAAQTIPAAQTIYFCSAGTRLPLENSSGTCPNADHPYRGALSIHTNKSVFVTGGTDTGVHTVIIAVHGDGRDPTEPYAAIAPDIAEFIKRNSSQGNGVALITPKFANNWDSVSGTEPWLRWTADGWAQGDDTSTHAKVSSFDVMDALARRAKARFPNVASIVFMGHSGGAQFVNRYSIGTTVEAALGAGPQLEVRYLMASPRTYLYFNDERHRSRGATIAAPATIVDCDAYNDYRLGPDNIPGGHYMAKYTTGEAMADNVRGKKRFFILGEQDNTVASADECGEKAQGESRLQRGLNYMYHLRTTDTDGNTGVCIVPDYCHYTGILGSWPAIYFWKLGELNCGYFRDNYNAGSKGANQLNPPPASYCPA